MMGEHMHTLAPRLRDDCEPTILRRRPLRKRLGAYLTASVRKDGVLKAELLALSFITGIEDVATFFDFHAFSSNHTGNTILLGIGASGMPSTFAAVQYIAASLPMFVLGGWVLGRLGNSVGCRRRWWLIVTNFIQSILVFAAAALRQWGHINFPKDIGDPIPFGLASVSVMILLAVSSGGQVAMARSLRVAEITTANATTVYVDLFMDRNLFKRRNRARNRRILFVSALMGGGCAGAFIHHRSGSGIVLLITAIGKLAVTFAILFNKEGREVERRGTRHHSPSTSEDSEYDSEEELPHYGPRYPFPPVLAEGLCVDVVRNMNKPCSSLKSRVHVYADLSLWELVVSCAV